MRAARLRGGRGGGVGDFGLGEGRDLVLEFDVLYVEECVFVEESDDLVLELAYLVVEVLWSKSDVPF